MDEVFERVVAENRKLQKEAKRLRERVAALESSRWWRLHPRFVAKRVVRSMHSDGRSRAGADEGSARTELEGVAQQWRLKLPYEERNRGAAPDEIALRDGLRLRIHPDSRSTFEQFCFASADMVDELDRFIATTKDRRRLLDVGAFQGIFSLVFAASNESKQALAVEPSPVAFAKLLYNLHRNAALRIEAVECALSNESGSLEMHYDWEQAVAGTGSGAPTLRVMSQTGDTLCEERGFAPDVIKIDVEGHEARVVEGLRRTIARNSPLIFLEAHPATIAANNGNGTLSDLARALAEVGYSQAELRGRVVPIDALIELNEIERLLLRPD